MIHAVKTLYSILLMLIIVGCGGGNSSDANSENNETLETNITKEDNKTATENRVNHSPIAKEQLLETDEEQSIEIELYAEDEDNDTLIYRVSAQPAHGQLEGMAPTLTYTPNLDFNGEDHFDFIVSDGEISSKEASVTINVKPINDIPKAISQTITVSNNHFKSIQLLGEDSDEDNLTYTIVQLPRHGELNGTAPSITYTPKPDYIGVDAFTFFVSDGSATSTIQEINITVTEAPQKVVTINGKVTYDFIPPKSNRQGLDYANAVTKSAQHIMVEILDMHNNLLQSTVSDENGSYQFTHIPANTDVKIRAYAKMLQLNQPSWSVKVVDNTQSNALYGLEGSLVSSGVNDSVRNLHASSGWDGASYSEARAAAPFAILGTVYQSMQNILNVDSNASFPPLTVNWSVNNRASAQLEVDIGDIVTSHYNEGNLYILGDANSDTDEYDVYVIAHEWGHYYEDKFSRTDSLGGSHDSGDHLDIRVAFGEGFGNAIAAITHDDPLYYDTYGIGQSVGWSMDIEGGTKVNAGWYSEASIQRILYDLYDESGDDPVSLGFKPMHDVFVGAQKNTSAFTSLFSFIAALKNENNDTAIEIDQLVAEEGIGQITDSYGSNRILLPSHYPYHDLIVGSTENICTTNTYGYLGSRNKLSNHKYVKFTIDSTGPYQIVAVRSNGAGSDPDFVIFQALPFLRIGYAESPFDDREQVSVTLSKGEYLLDLFDWNSAENACFDISIEAI